MLCLNQLIGEALMTRSHNAVFRQFRIRPTVENQDCTIREVLSRISPDCQLRIVGQDLDTTPRKMLNVRAAHWAKDNAEWLWNLLSEVFLTDHRRTVECIEGIQEYLAGRSFFGCIFEKPGLYDVLESEIRREFNQESDILGLLKAPTLAFLCEHASRLTRFFDPLCRVHGLLDRASSEEQRTWMSEAIVDSMYATAIACDALTTVRERLAKST